MIVAILSLCMVFTVMAQPVWAGESSKNENTIGKLLLSVDEQTELIDAYENIIEYAEDNNIELDMEFSDFIEEYDGESVESYEESYYSVLEPESTNSSSSSNNHTYYYNTGTSCPSQATYSKYKLLEVVKKGDVIYEANGGGHISGHIAIVEGIYTKNGRKYIRIIEAINEGGCAEGFLTIQERMKKVLIF